MVEVAKPVITIGGVTTKKPTKDSRELGRQMAEAVLK